MLFNSLIFIIFLLPVLGIYWSIPGSWRKGFLVLASYVFYASWDWRFLSLIVASTIIDFVVARSI